VRITDDADAHIRVADRVHQKAAGLAAVVADGDDVYVLGAIIGQEEVRVDAVMNTSIRFLRNPQRVLQYFALVG
jgi:hypothetical protein